MEEVLASKCCRRRGLLTAAAELAAALLRYAPLRDARCPPMTDVVLAACTAHHLLAAHIRRGYIQFRLCLIFSPQLSCYILYILVHVHIVTCVRAFRAVRSPTPRFQSCDFIYYKTAHATVCGALPLRTALNRLAAPLWSPAPPGRRPASSVKRCRCGAGPQRAASTPRRPGSSGEARARRAGGGALGGLGGAGGGSSSRGRRQAPGGDSTSNFGRSWGLPSNSPPSKSG